MSTRAVRRKTSMNVLYSWKFFRSITSNNLRLLLDNGNADKCFFWRSLMHLAALSSVIRFSVTLRDSMTSTLFFRSCLVILRIPSSVISGNIDNVMKHKTQKSTNNHNNKIIKMVGTLNILLLDIISTASFKGQLSIQWITCNVPYSLPPTFYRCIIYIIHD